MYSIRSQSLYCSSCVGIQRCYDITSSGGVWKAMDAEKSGGRPSWFSVNEIHAHDWSHCSTYMLWVVMNRVYICIYIYIHIYIYSWYMRLHTITYHMYLWHAITCHTMPYRTRPYIQNQARSCHAVAYIHPCIHACIDLWEFQDPKIEVLYQIRPHFVGIFSYIGLNNRPNIYDLVGTSNEIPEMASDYIIESH